MIHGAPNVLELYSSQGRAMEAVMDGLRPFAGREVESVGWRADSFAPAYEARGIVQDFYECHERTFRIRDAAPPPREIEHVSVRLREDDGRATLFVAKERIGDYAFWLDACKAMAGYYGLANVVVAALEGDETISKRGAFQVCSASLGLAGVWMGHCEPPASWAEAGYLVTVSPL